MQQLSLCIIVGNEQKHIERFIESFRPAIDELCVVRAIGNQTPDSTMDIVESTCKRLNLPVQTSEYINKDNTLPHIDDFATARNLSFDLATKEFRMWADCDDILDVDSIPKIKEFLADPKEVDHIFCFYKLGHNRGLLRERIFRSDVGGGWHNPVHECYASPSTHRAIREDIVIIHSPIRKNATNSFGRNLTIMQNAIKDAACPPIVYFYICRDASAVGLIELSLNAGIKALTLDIGEHEKYETYLILFGLASQYKKLPAGYIDLEDFKRWCLLEAIALIPWRREAIGGLVLLLIEQEKYQQALGWMMHMQGIPEPQIKPWTHRAAWYGYQYLHTMAKCLRLCKRDSEAATIEKKVFERANNYISICHATARGRDAILLKEKLLAKAEHPLAIEYIFAVDEDDTKTLEELKGERIVLNPRNSGPVSAWNLAAKESSGKILIQMSDDWILPDRWDKGIFDCINDAVESNKHCVLLVDDSNRKDVLVTMAIMTRAYYEKYGYMFHPDFWSMYSDNELTVRALKDNALLDCRHYLKFMHDHPLCNPEHYKDGKLDDSCLDEVYRKSNHPDNYRHGLAVFKMLHPNQSPIVEVDKQPSI